MIQKFLLIVLLIFPAISLYAEDSVDDLFSSDIIEDENSTTAAEETGGDSIDDLFNTEIIDNENDKNNTASQQNNSDKKEKFKSSITVNGGVTATGGYTGGWTDLDFTSEFKNVGVLALKSNLRINADIAKNFRVYMALNANLPDISFEISELFIDYRMSEFLWLRMGRETVTWGYSGVFSYTNLPQRVPDEGGSYQPLSLRITVPILTGSAQGLIYSRNASADLESLGFGLFYNFIIRGVDSTLGVYYQKDLDTRIFYSINGTLFKKLDLYSEGVAAIYADTANGYNLGWGISAGFSIEFFDRNLRFGGEYYYNAENYADPDTGTMHYPDYAVNGETFKLIDGHNIFLAGSFHFFNGKMKLYTYWYHNFNVNTGYIVPGYDFDLMDEVRITLRTPIILGNDNGEYAIRNPDSEKRRMAIALTVKISGDF